MHELVYTPCGLTGPALVSQLMTHETVQGPRKGKASDFGIPAQQPCAEASSPSGVLASAFPGSKRALSVPAGLGQSTQTDVASLPIGLTAQKPEPQLSSGTPSQPPTAEPAGTHRSPASSGEQTLPATEPQSPALATAASPVQQGPSTTTPDSHHQAAAASQSTWTATSTPLEHPLASTGDSGGCKCVGGSAGGSGGWGAGSGRPGGGSGGSGDVPDPHSPEDGDVPGSKRSMAVLAAVVAAMLGGYLNMAGAWVRYRQSAAVLLALKGEGCALACGTWPLCLPRTTCGASVQACYT